MRVFICYTPLHALIINKIINDEKLIDTKVFYISKRKSDINKRYSDLNNSSFFCLDNKLSYLNLIFKFVRFSIINQINVIYFGNINKSLSRLLYFIASPKSLITFDDGVGHISGRGYFYNLSEVGLKKFLFLYVFPSYSYKALINRIDKHYSIFSMESWGDIYTNNCQKISLLYKTDKSDRIKRGEVRILLGSCLAEDGFLPIEKETQFETDFIEKYKIELYLPHPRRTLLSTKNIMIEMKNDDIAENVISELSGIYEKVFVYGISSTVLVNVHSIENVTVTNIKFKNIVSNVSCFYESIGIKALDIDR